MQDFYFYTENKVEFSGNVFSTFTLFIYLNLFFLVNRFLQKSKPGDLIEIIRGNYSHWAVYVGNGYVVHFGAPKSQSGSSIGGVDGIVMKEKLEDVAGKDKWRVNNSLDKKYKPLPPDEIVKKACSLVGVSLKYHLTKYNCEHFATEMRYGKAESRQTDGFCCSNNSWSRIHSWTSEILTGNFQLLR
uniref:LRAT domain-containing protein n=1 Tax=Oryzias latipes TaxID=8090 RepID=A0A3P9H857_ORYLA